jgi:hypothetical protein
MAAQASVIQRPVRRRGRDRRPAGPLPARRSGSVPLVTVGLPVCTGENLVERAVESIPAPDDGEVGAALAGLLATPFRPRRCGGQRG